MPKKPASESAADPLGIPVAALNGIALVTSLHGMSAGPDRPKPTIAPNPAGAVACGWRLGVTRAWK